MSLTIRYSQAEEEGEAISGRKNSMDSNQSMPHSGDKELLSLTAVHGV